MKRKNLIKLPDVNLIISESKLMNFYSSGRENHFKKLSDNMLDKEKLDSKDIQYDQLTLTQTLIAQPYLYNLTTSNNLMGKTKIIDYFGEGDNNYFNNIFQVIYIINEHWDKSLEKYLCNTSRSLVYFPYKNSAHENAIAAIGAWNGNPDFYESTSLNEIGDKRFQDLYLNFDKCLIFYPE